MALISVALNGLDNYRSDEQMRVFLPIFLFPYGINIGDYWPTATGKGTTHNYDFKRDATSLQLPISTKANATITF